MISDDSPQLIRTYQNHTLDSTRWNHYVPREDDIIVSSSYKSGTTWVQNITLCLIHEQKVKNTNELSPWLDYRIDKPIKEIIDCLEAQEHRRCIKSHLALDGLPFYNQVKYIVVARDARDVFMSWWNHYSNHTTLFYLRVNRMPGRVGKPLPRCPKDIHEYWRTWITQGWFEWEIEGYPQWGNMHHTQTWWNFRHLKNILFVHFNDLLANPSEEIQRIAQFLGIDVSADFVSYIVDATSFSNLKENAIKNPSAWSEAWKEGAKTFFFKGTNGRWKEVLSEDELAMYETTKSQVLTAECAQWLEQGRIALLR